MAQKPTIGYWGIRGLGASIRALLEHLAVDFEDKMYGPNMEPGTGWSDVKATIEIPFANLPYIIDEDVKISENKAVLRFVCQKYKPEYLGRTLKE
jgi:glutathione S-transferase